MGGDLDRGVKVKLRTIRTRFLLYVVGSFLLYSAYGTLVNLQSSINIVDGLGTISLAVTYLVAVFFCLTFSSLIIRRFGPKKSLWISECGHLIYILANFYPRFYTMIPAAILLGIGDAMFWNCLPLMNAFFARSYSKTRKHTVKDDTYYVKSFSGYYFTIFQCQKIFGNLVSYVALYAFSNTSSQNPIVANVTNTSTVIIALPRGNYTFCGANDCQDANIVSDHLDQYKPVPVALYTLMGSLSAMALLAILMHAFLIPNGQLDVKGGNRDAILGDKVIRDSNSNPILYNEKIDSISLAKEDLKGLSLVKKSLLDVTIQLFTPKQMLLVPLIMYAGMHYVYAFSELTRAYSSCVVGVSWVPLHIVVFGLGAVVVSFITGKFGHIIGVGGFLCISFVLDIASYIFNIFWTPDPVTAWSLFLLYFASGVSQAIWISQTMVTQVLYFSANPEVSCSLWTAVYMSGMALEYSWSTSVCIRQKIYIQLGIVSVGMLSYAALRKIQTKGKQNSETHAEELHTLET